MRCRKSTRRKLRRLSNKEREQKSFPHYLATAPVSKQALASAWMAKCGCQLTKLPIPRKLAQGFACIREGITIRETFQNSSSSLLCNTYLLLSLIRGVGKGWELSGWLSLITCWSFRFNLVTYLCMGLVFKFFSLVDVLFGSMASTLEAYKSAFKTLGSVAKQVFTIVTWQNFNNSGVELAFLNLYDFLMRLVLAKGLGPMRAFQQ